MSKRYSGKSFKDSSVMRKPKLSLKEKRKIKREKKKKNYVEQTTGKRGKNCSTERKKKR